MSLYAHAFRHPVKSSYFVVMVILFSLMHVILFPNSHCVWLSACPRAPMVLAGQNLHSGRDCLKDIQEEAPHPWGNSLLSPPGPGQ